MINLEILNFVEFDLQHSLHGALFQGLSNLKTLNLSNLITTSIESDAMSLLTNLNTLIMPHSSGFESFPFEALKGPKNLEILDLTETQIFPSNDIHDVTAPTNLGSMIGKFMN